MRDPVVHKRMPSDELLGRDRDASPSPTRTRLRARSNGDGSAAAATLLAFSLSFDVSNTAATCRFRRRATAASGGGRARYRTRTRAHTGFGQHQLDLGSSLVIACDLRRDRTHLLVTGQHQEGGRTTVTLHASEVEAGLGLRQLSCAMRAHCESSRTSALSKLCGASSQRWRRWQQTVDGLDPDSASCLGR